MRLLSTETLDGLHLHYFQDKSNYPRCTIISHVWGQYELLCEHVVSGKYDKGWEGYQKVIGCCKIALQEGYHYIWIDTCCIDKSSSAELQEAINSMVDWYKEAAICYTHLADVSQRSDPHVQQSEFRQSKSFARGWTLQELIAPEKAIFPMKNRETVGDKVGLAETIVNITGVDYGSLCGLLPIQEVSVARKMSWASKRNTTRLEDRAYSLLGLFGVNMPAISGEGTKAFYRLQQEIMRSNADHSIFAWGVMGINSTLRGILANSPSEYEDSATTMVGLRLEVPVIQDPNSDPLGDQWIYIGLACKNLVSDAPSRRLGTVDMLLMRARGATDIYVRPSLTGVLDFNRMAAVCGNWDVEHIHIADHYHWGGDEWTSFIPKLCVRPSSISQSWRTR